MMKPNEFDASARDLFGAVLKPFGFSCERSKASVFYREVSSGFFHIVLPDLGTRGVWYDVKVFAFASILDPKFAEHFPDSLGIPTDSFCYLSERGIGPDQVQFNCKTDETLRQRFSSTVAPILLSVALPYLTQFTMLSSLLHHIRNPLYRAIATHYVGGPNAARGLLKEQHERLCAANTDSKDVAAMLTRIEELIRAQA